MLFAYERDLVDLQITQGLHHEASMFSEASISNY